MPVNNTNDVLALIKEQSKNFNKQYITNLKDIYYDRWNYIIEQELQAQFSAQAYERLDLLQTKEVNILKQFVNETAVLYMKSPDRIATVGETPDETYTQIVKQNKLNNAMKLTNKLCKLTNHVLVRPVWRDTDIDYDIITFDNAEIYFDPKNWKRIKAIRYFIGLQLPEYGATAVSGNPKISASEGRTRLTTGGMVSSYSKAYTYYRDDNDVIWIYTTKPIGNGDEIEIEPAIECPYKINGKHVFPFVLFSSEYTNDCNLSFTRNDDLFDATINCAVNMCHLNELMKYQSHIQGVIRTSDKSKIGQKFRLGASEFVVMESNERTNDGVDTISLESNYNGFWETIKDRVAYTLSQYGISPQNYNLSGSAQSGLSLKIKNKKLREIREDDISLYREYEQELFEKTRAVNNYHNTKKINEAATFAIDYAEMEQVDDVAADDTHWEFMFRNGVATPVDYIKYANPDIDDKEAEKLYMKNKKMRESNLTVPAPLTLGKKEKNDEEEPEETEDDE